MGTRNNNAQVCNYIYVGFTTASVKAGNGRHSLALDPKDLERANMLNMAGFPAGVMSFCTPKLAVVALLVRILNPSIRHRIFLWSLTGFTTVYLVVCFLILYIQCDPPRALWDYDLQMSGDFTCWDSKVLVNMSIAGAGMSLEPEFRRIADHVGSIVRDGRFIPRRIPGHRPVGLADVLEEETGTERGSGLWMLVRVPCLSALYIDIDQPAAPLPSLYISAQSFLRWEIN